MFWGFIIFIILIIIISINFNREKPIQNPRNESHNDFIKRTHKINDDLFLPSEDNPESYLLFLKDVEQNKIDFLKEKGYAEKINDYILKRAFISRWRYEKLDYDYYKEMLDRRNERGTYKKKNNNNKKNTSRKRNILKRVYECKGAFVPDRKAYILDNVLEGDSVIFKEEPTNRHDPFAIKIVHNRKRIGYVGREDQDDIKHLLDQNYEAIIHRIKYNGKYLDVFYKIQSCDHPTI